MNEFEKLVESIKESIVDADKFYNKNNKSAGKRLRKRMQEIKAMAQAVRTEVLTITKNEE